MGKLRRRPAWWSDSQHRAAILAALFGAAATVIGALIATWNAPTGEPSYLEIAKHNREFEQVVARISEQRSLESHRINQELSATHNKIVALEAQLAITHPGSVEAPSEAVLRQLGSLKASEDEARTRIARLSQDSVATGERIARLESVILSDPQKAVAIPLIQRDVAALDAKLTSQIQGIQADNSRLYDLMKWLVGLMGIVSLSLIGTAAGNLFKRDSRDTATPKVTLNTSAQSTGVPAAIVEADGSPRGALS